MRPAAVQFGAPQGGTRSGSRHSTGIKSRGSAYDRMGAADSFLDTFKVESKQSRDVEARRAEADRVRGISPDKVGTVRDRDLPFRKPAAQSATATGSTFGTGKAEAFLNSLGVRTEVPAARLEQAGQASPPAAARPVRAAHAQQRAATAASDHRWPHAAAKADVAKSYGVQRSLRLEEKLETLQREVHGNTGGLPPSGWRRASELEHKLHASEEAAAASRLQVGMLREENRRKGRRITQLEGLLSDLEKDYRVVRARLSGLDSEGGAVHEPCARQRRHAPPAAACLVITPRPSTLGPRPSRRAGCPPSPPRPSTARSRRR